MNTSLAAMRRSASSRTASVHLAVLVFCLGVASVTAPAANEPPGGAVAAASPPLPPALTVDEILTVIPAPTGTAQSDKALSEVLSKARQTPEDAKAWVDVGDTLAQVLRDSGDRKYYDLAELAYVRALKIKPQSVDAMVGMAWVAEGRGASEQSVAWAKRALALDAKNAAACGIIGDVALKLGDYDEAFENYQMMMDLKPDLSSWSRGATLLWITGNRNKAIWLMERANKAGAPFAENTAWCRAKYAMMLFDDGALVPAAQVLDPALAVGSRNPQVLLAAGTIAAARHDFAAATWDYQKALEKKPSLEVLAALGDLCVAKNEKAEAEKYYAQLESLYKSDPAADDRDPMFMAKFDADHDRNLGQALGLAEERKETKNVLEADILAWVYFKCGDHPHAIEEMKFALSRNTADAGLHFHAGMIAAAANDRVSAQKHLQAALSYNPHFDLLQAPIAVATLQKLGSTPPMGNGTPAP